MQKTLYLAAVLLLSVATAGQAQDNNIADIARVSNCTIDDGFTFGEVVERARAFPRSENAPDRAFFRRPIYTSAQYQENWDFQMALFYPSFTEMANRRVAQGNRGRGGLPISCNGAQVLRNFTAHQVDLAAFTGQATTMTTSFCRLTDGSLRGAFNRIRTVSQNYAAAGSGALVSMYLPGLGGPLNRNSDFVLAVVGTSREALTESLDLRLNGFRPDRGNNSTAGFTCDRPSLWATATILPPIN